MARISHQKLPNPGWRIKWMRAETIFTPISGIRKKWNAGSYLAWLEKLCAVSAIALLVGMQTKQETGYCPLIWVFFRGELGKSPTSPTSHVIADIGRRAAGHHGAPLLAQD